VKVEKLMVNIDDKAMADRKNLLMSVANNPVDI
jgi:hypothetical protein